MAISQRPEAIEFVADGRFYEPTGDRAVEFLAVYGSLIAGPARPEPGTLVTRFLAEVRRGTTSEPVYYEADLDFPLPDEPGEGPFVLLYGARPEDVPAGCRITARADDPRRGD